MIGGNYEPKIITSYQGGDIPLNDTYTLSEKEFPSLKRHHNDTLIVTDGDHLLGGDDKAGITIIMEVIKYFTSHKEIDHAPIRICFTPDEEVGRGSEHFDVKVMDADFAYTLDGGTFNDINYENFNAFSARVMIKGINIHPGSAKDIMINSILIGQEFNALLPQDEIPSKTSDYQGFYHLCDIKGSVEETTLDYIIRDHDYQKALEKVNKMKEITSFLQNKYPKAIISLNIKESYHNMKEYFIKDMSAIDKITNVFKKHQIKPTFTPIRGGTDGASITFMGLPCPNLGTGDYNCHGRYEYVSVNEMKQMVEIIKDLLID
jgi:tripeptide aminopeptidase